MPVMTMRVHIAEGQYEISDWDPDREFGLPSPGGASGLVGVSPGVAVVVTGTQFGNVSNDGSQCGAWPGYGRLTIPGGTLQPS